MNEQNMQLAEQLLDMLDKGGDSAFWIALLWTVEPYFNGLLVAGVILTLVFIAIKMVRVFEKTCRFADEVRKAAGCGMPCGEIKEYERERVLELIRAGRQALDK